MVERAAKDLIFVMGGARSGKSSWALRYAEGHGAAPLYLATAEVTDEEMAERIRLHREARGPHWRTVEEPLEIAQVFGTLPPEVDVVLIDCLTVWLGNILLKAGEDRVRHYEAVLMEALAQRTCTVVAVANEVGMGVVPVHPLGRKFRDLAGWLNQEMAAVADRVIWTVAGLPLEIKGRDETVIVK